MDLNITQITLNHIAESAGAGVEYTECTSAEG